VLTDDLVIILAKLEGVVLQKRPTEILAGASDILPSLLNSDARVDVYTTAELGTLRGDVGRADGIVPSREHRENLNWFMASNRHVEDASGASHWIFDRTPKKIALSH
jgi:hypothetical protein